MVNIRSLRKAAARAIAGCRDGGAARVRHAMACSMAASLLATGHGLAEGVDHGAQIAATCASCHRLDGDERGIPRIIGLGEEKLTRVMLAYRSSEHPSRIMHAIALSLSDEEIASVARFLAAQDTKATPP